MKQKKPPAKTARVRTQKRKSPLDTIIAGRKPTMRTIKSLVLEIKSYLQPAGKFSEAINAFNKQTASQTAKNKRVPVLYGPGRNGNLVPSFGCYTQSKLLHTLLKKMGVKAKLFAYFVDNKGRIIATRAPSLEMCDIKPFGVGMAEKHRAHASVFFEMNGKTYNADPFFGIVYEMKPIILERLYSLAPHRRFQDISRKKIGFSEFSDMQKTGKL
jgi:hypothetical protein